MDTQLTVRTAQAEADFATLVEFRLAMFRDMGWTDEARLSELAPRYAAYLREHFSAGDFTGWIAEKDGRPVASVGLLWERVPPTVRNLSGRQAYVLGLYVIPEARRQGIARSLLDRAVAHARDFGADVVSLHYSPDGQDLYRKYGFVESPEMRLFTDPTSSQWAPHAPAHTPADDAD
jgi:ribosomal protein S18 acetylase RimI-like enzyme